MNSYNIFNKAERATILFRAIAENENMVKSLAKKEGVNIKGLIIEIERTNVKDQLGKPFPPSIRDAIVH